MAEKLQQSGVNVISHRSEGADCQAGLMVVVGGAGITAGAGLDPVIIGQVPTFKKPVALRNGHFPG